MPGDDVYDELFSAPVEDFVARRDALVKQLKAEGDKEQAAVVKSWRRPTRVVGALNRLALTDDGAAADFVDAARALGSTRGAELREANEQFRAAVKRVAASAVDGLGDARPSDLGEVTAALLTLGSDEDALSSFQDGRLLDLPDAGQGGFGFGLGVDLAAEPPARPKRATTKKQTPADREDELAERRRRAERMRLEAAVDEAATGVRKANEVVAAARERVEEATRRRDEAQEALTSAEAEAEAAAADAADAQQALEEAEAALEG
jgi:hypothetical protein